MVKDVGAVAIGDQCWEIYIGGAAGAHVRKGDLICTVTGDDEVIVISGRFMQYYRENAKWKKRTYDFMPRIGVDELRAIVIDNRDGIAADLDVHMQASVEVAYDPWKEATMPKTANQFANLIAVSA